MEGIPRKGRHLSLQNPHLPTWLSSRSPSLRYLQNPSSLLTTKIRSNSLNPSFAHPHIRPISSTSSTLVGSEIIPLGPTPLNTPTSAKRRTAATTLRLACRHPLSYPIHPVRRRPTTRTLPRKFVLTPCLNQQSSIYVPSIDHKDLAHIPDPSSCRQAGLSICQTSRPPNLPCPFQSLAQRLRSRRQCHLGPLRQSLPPTTTSTQSSSAQLRTDSSPLSPTARPTWRCNITASPTELRDSRTASLSTKRPSSGPQRATSSMTAEYPISASHAAPGFPARPNGSNSTTMARCRASQTPTAQNQTPTLPTCMPNLTINTLKTSMRSLRLALPARVASCSRARQNRSTNLKTFHVKPRPRAARGSVSLTDVVVRPSGGVMLPALRSPARSDLPHLM